MRILHIENQFKGLGGQYLKNPKSFEAFFPYGLSDDAFENRKNDVLALEYDRNGLSDALYKGNELLGASKETLMNCERLKNSTSTVVVTGQQAGLVTGPLYTLYKAARTISLAKMLEQRWGTPVIPIFWVASEDHDFDEVSAVHLSSAGKIATHSVGKKDSRKQSIGNHILGNDEEELLRQVMEFCKDELHIQELSAVLNETFFAGEDYGKWFGRIIVRLFASHGLVVIDPMWQCVRCLQKPFLEQAISLNEKVDAAFRQQTELVKELGHQPAIELNERHSCLFKYDGGERLPLFRTADGEFEVESSKGVHRYSPEALLEIVTNNPEKFSTNVVLRPVVQEVLMPNIAYVGGPGEIAYHAQLTEVYGHFGRKMPVLVPRLQVTMVESDAVGIMRRYGLDIGDIFVKKQIEVENAFLKQVDEYDVEGRFMHFRDAFVENYEALIGGLGPIHEEMGDLIAKNRGMMSGQIDYLEDKVRSHHRRRFKDELKDIAKVCGTVRPNGDLQERIINFSVIYAKLGKSWIDVLVDTPAEELRHLVMYCEDMEA